MFTCKIAKGEIHSIRENKDDEFIAFRDIRSILSDGRANEFICNT